MSSLTTNNITINKITSSNGKFSGDNASGRIELRVSNIISSSTLLIPWKFDIREGGFVNIKFKSFGGNIYEEYIYESVDNYKYTSTFGGIEYIIISGSKINGIYNKTQTSAAPPDSNEYNLNELEITLNSFQFPKDSPEEIDCENIFANWNLQGELPELDDRISNLNGAFANTHITGEIPKLPKNLKYASNTFLNCSSLTGVSKDLLAQHVTAQKPYIKYETSENMVSGCIKSVTSWFSVDNGGDHDNIEYTVWTSSRNAATSFPYISLTLPRSLKDNYNCRVIYKNFERYSGFTSTVFCSRDVMGKNTSIFCNTPSEAFRFDTNSAQTTIQLDANKIKNLRPCDFTVVEKGSGKLKLTLFNALKSEEFERNITETSSQLSTKIATLFASQINGNPASNQGKIAIAELDIWDDQGYLIKMRSQGTSMVDLVSGTTYSSASATPFVTLPIEIREEDKYHLITYEKNYNYSFPLSFWDEYSVALNEYKKDPTLEKTWTTIRNDDGTISSNIPHYHTLSAKPIIDLNVTSVTGFVYNNVSTPAFHRDTNSIIFLPSAKIADRLIPYCKKFNNPVILPIATKTIGSFVDCDSLTSDIYVPNLLTGESTFTRMEKYNKPMTFLKATSTYGAFYMCVSLNSIIEAPNTLTAHAMFEICSSYNQYIYFPLAKNCDRLIGSCRAFDNIANLPSCSSAINAFQNTGMSARNIAKTLNSLPKWTDGTVHTITFRGCPGIEWEETTETFNGIANCPKFTKDTEGKALRKAFAKAVTNGWTVEIGTATNAASTMSLRNLQYYKKTESDYGDYIDSEGKTYIISTGDAFSNEGKNLGYEQFSCIEECLESWNLTEIPREDTVPFEEFIEEEQLEELEDGSNLEEYTQERI